MRRGLTGGRVTKQRGYLLKTERQIEPVREDSQCTTEITATQHPRHKYAAKGARQKIKQVKSEG